MSDTTFVSIAAVAENGVIGADGDIPWEYPEDLRHFKQTTMDHPIIMGRRTYTNIAPDHDSHLPGRTPHIVLTSRDLDVPDGVVLARSVDEAVSIAEQTPADTAYVIGGASVYEAFMPLVDRLVITKIPGVYDGDVYFPQWDESWDECERSRLSDDLVVVTYEP